MTETRIYSSLLGKHAMAQPLSDAPAGQSVLIAGLEGGRTAQTRLISLGFALGRELQVVQNHGGRVIVSLNGHRVALGQGMSQKILVIPASSLPAGSVPPTA